MHVHSTEEQPIVIQYFSRLQLRETFDSKSSTASSRLLSPESSLLPFSRPLSSSLRRVQQVFASFVKLTHFISIEQTIGMKILTSISVFPKYRHSSKEKRLASDTCLCSSNNSSNLRSCNRNDHTVIRESTCNNCHGKDSEKALTMQEQNDEELDDSVATINHKDSLCILVEKYKTNKKCKHKAYFNGVEFTDERKDECDKSFSSETCQLDENGKQGGNKYSGYDNSRFRDNRGAPIRKPPCRYGDCGQMFKEGDTNQFKNLKSRLIKSGNYCSAKGTPWRHTF